MASPLCACPCGIYTPHWAILSLAQVTSFPTKPHDCTAKLSQGGISFGAGSDSERIMELLNEKKTELKVSISVLL